MKKSKNNKKVKNKLSYEQLIAEIGTLTVKVEELSDKNRFMERELLSCKIKNGEIKGLLDKYQKFREDLIGFIMRY